MFTSVFSSDPLLKTQWGKDELKEDKVKMDKPDFLIYSKYTKFKCVIMIAKINPSYVTSSKESDLVKLGIGLAQWLLYGKF
ncbi:unnamed protein product [Cunninghamella blakesleeana]